MDRKDIQILEELQKDASLSLSEVSERVALSKPACWRRIGALEAQGVIKARVTIVNPRKVNLGVSVYASVRTDHHCQDWFSKFSKAVQEVPEVLEMHRLSGDKDYLLRIVAPDIDGYSAIYNRLIGSVEMSDFNSSFVMQTLKHTTVLPLGYAGRAGGN